MLALPLLWHNVAACHALTTLIDNAVRHDDYKGNKDKLVAYCSSCRGRFGPGGEQGCAQSSYQAWHFAQ